ncbi:P pilus assembly chaperone PapD [Acinetobacter calcoaceticus]|uniref:P pilus assembly chaperone PapD n=1 Tax=Acinetobacter calcoaceticus TaxID=471 RepID=A0A4R1Y6T6_ACICA|nr:P pilus assembly chaperone PapD [Acinetobacter calcoaceticus]
MKFKKGKFLLGAAALMAVASTVSYAELVIQGTRVIYPSDAREITLQLDNTGGTPSLIQAWIDNGDEKITPDQSTVPFMITPPISRIEPKKSQTLRITALPNASQFDQKQETVLWLNVIDIPPKPESVNETAVPENYIQLAVRSRIKFFYRPAALVKDAFEAPEKIQWIKSADKLVIKNPTPYHITVNSILQKDGSKSLDLLSESLMLKPFSEHSVPFKNNNLNDMSFVNINDYGGHAEYKIKL